MPIEAVNCVRQDVIEKVLKDEVVDISFTNEGEPFTILIQEFESEDACYEYINSKENYPTIAIEVIAIAGFNDPVNDIDVYQEQSKGIFKCGF